MNIRNDNKVYFKKGLKESFTAIILIALIVFANIAFNLWVPESIKTIDTSGNGLYNISNETKDILKGIQETVSLNYISNGSNEEDDVINFVQRFCDSSSKLNFNLIDPSLHPTYTSLSNETYNSEDLTNGKIIVTSELKDSVLTSADLYQSTYSDEELAMYYQYYGSVPQDNVTSFVGESKLLSSVLKVSSATVPKVYCTTGHDEESVGTILSEKLSDDNIEISELSLLTAEKIPDDASAIMINAPKSDLTETEYNLISDYLKNNGNLIVFIGFASVDEKFENINKLLSDNFGVSVDTQNIVFETSKNNMYQIAYYIVPNNTDNVQGIPKTNRLLPVCSPIIKSENSDSEITDLLVTSDKAYIRPASDQNPSEPANDELKEYSLSITAKSNTCNLFLISCAQSNIDGADNVVNGANTDFSVNYINNLVKNNDDGTVSVSTISKNIESTSIMVPDSVRTVIFILVSIVLPVILIVMGLVIWISRRKQK